jgi:HlyD family secretion protein
MTMNVLNRLSLVGIVLSLASACNKTPEFDATGAFEADEIIISAEQGGVLMQYDLSEGQTVKAGQVAGYIDTIPLALKKEQILYQIEALRSRKPDSQTQLKTLKTQLQTAQRELIRFEKLKQADAASQKQIDDLNSQCDVLQSQIDAQQSSLNISNQSIDSDTKALMTQVKQIDDQIRRSILKIPTDGTILLSYVNTHEMIVPGKALYQIAQMNTMKLRVFVSADQLIQIKLNQNVSVKTDDGHGGTKTYTGKVSWISSKAEFTPKTIQTKNERAHQVFAVKIDVPNDGYLKIGMYGEVVF